MRKIHNIIYTLLAVMVATAFAACSDDDNYEWAKQVGEDNPGVYFASSNKASELLTPDEYANHQTFSITVKRANTKGNLSVPIIVDNADPAFVIPTSAEFKDGESETQIEIGCPNLEMLKTYRFIIHLADNMTNPYVKTDGSPIFNYDVMVARWIKVVNQAQFVWGKNEFGSTTSDIYWLEGQNRFRIENWLGSGIDLQFSIVAQDKEDSSVYTADAFDPDDRSTWHGAFQPYSNYLNDPGGGSFWFFMRDVENEEYAAWYPDGEDKAGIDFVNFWLDTTSEDYSSVDMRGSSSSFALYLVPYIYYTNGDQSGYTYLYGYWNSMLENAE